MGYRDYNNIELLNSKMTCGNQLYHNKQRVKQTFKLKIIFIAEQTGTKGLKTM